MVAPHRCPFDPVLFHNRNGDSLGSPRSPDGGPLMRCSWILGKIDDWATYGLATNMVWCFKKCVWISYSVDTCIIDPFASPFLDCEISVHKQ